MRSGAAGCRPDRCVMGFNFILLQTSQNTSSFLIYLEMSAIDDGKVIDFHLRTDNLWFTVKQRKL